MFAKLEMVFEVRPDARERIAQNINHADLPHVVVFQVAPILRGQKAVQVREVGEEAPVGLGSGHNGFKPVEVDGIAQVARSPAALALEGLRCFCFGTRDAHGLLGPSFALFAG